MSDQPPGWATARLDEIADVRLGRQRSPKNHAGPRMRPYLRAANVTWTGLDLLDVKEMNFTEEESAIYELRAGDVLVAEASGSASEVGKPAIWRNEITGCCFQNTLIRVRTLHASPEFLRYRLLLEARSGRIGTASPGVGIHHIGAARLSAWPIPLPPLNEQRRIVAAIEEHLSRLDSADVLLDRGDQRLGRLQAAIFLDATRGHMQVELGAVTTAHRYGTSVKCLPRADGPPVLRIPNIRKGFIDTTDLKFATTQELGDCLVESGDLLFVRTNGSRDLIGRAAAVDGAAGMAFASYLIRARPIATALDPRWAVIALSTQSVRAEIEARAASTAGQYNLNLASLRSLLVPLPPLDEQRRIMARVEEGLSAIDALRAAIEQAQRRSASLRRAVLKRAFRGELVPQDPSDEPASVLLERIASERATAEGATGRRPRRRATMGKS